MIPVSQFDGLATPCTDAEHLNAIMNADGVREFLKLPDGVDDISPLIGRCLFLASEHGFVMFEPKAPGCYTFHTAILPASRGRDGYKLCRSACEYMFTRTDALELHTHTPHDNPAAKPPKTFGFLPWFSSKTDDFYRLHIMDWARKASNLDALGEWFHEALETAKEAQGATVEAHDHDPANNRYAGLACALVIAGDPAKAVWAYNHWAMTAGYFPIRWTGSHPIEIDTGDAVIRFADNEAEFVQCR
jgi:hypothetical protein